MQFYTENAVSGTDKAIVIHPFTGYPSKVWPGERFSALMKKLVAIYSTEVIIIDTVRGQRAGIWIRYRQTRY